MASRAKRDKMADPSLQLQPAQRIVALQHKLNSAARDRFGKPHMMHAVDVSPLQIAGGCLLLADMLLTTVLFAYWEKAGQMRLRIGKR